MLKDFDNGNGICKHLDMSSNLCMIYDKRPIICNVEASYGAFFSFLPYDEYIELNVKGCEMLKNNGV